MAQASEIVHTVRDPHGAWALMTDEAKADLYAVQVHGVRGPDMTREQAAKLVAETCACDTVNSIQSRKT